HGAGERAANAQQFQQARPVGRQADELGRYRLRQRHQVPPRPRSAAGADRRDGARRARARRHLVATSRSLDQGTAAVTKPRTFWARAALFSAFGFAVVLGACSSPDPVLYTIAPVAGPTKIGGPKVVVIERVQVANYLDRSQIVRSSEDYRVDLKSNDWWGESLATMLRRVVRQELAQRLPHSSILSETGAVSATPDATLDIAFQRLHRHKSGSVVLPPPP